MSLITEASDGHFYSSFQLSCSRQFWLLWNDFSNLWVCSLMCWMKIIWCPALLTGHSAFGTYEGTILCNCLILSTARVSGFKVSSALLTFWGQYRKWCAHLQIHTMSAWIILITKDWWVTLNVQGFTNSAPIIPGPLRWCDKFCSVGYWHAVGWWKQDRSFFSFQVSTIRKCLMSAPYHPRESLWSQLSRNGVGYCTFYMSVSALIYLTIYIVFMFTLMWHVCAGPRKTSGPTTETLHGTMEHTVILPHCQH